MPYGVKDSIKNRFLGYLLPRLPEKLCYFGFNGTIIIEPTNSCNLKCPVCPTSQNMKRKKGFMKFEDFKNIVDSIEPITKKIYMNFAGEPLLNKNIFEMVRYAEEKGISTLVSTNTTLLDRYIDGVLSSKLSKLIVCLDGASKETHESYRVGSDFDKVKENIRTLCKAKSEAGLVKPEINLQFVVMKKNENEIQKMVEIAEELGVNSLTLKSFAIGTQHNHEEKIKLAMDFLPNNKEFRRYDYSVSDVELEKKPDICPWIRQSVILWNGDVTLCCYDFNGELVVGNIFEKDFKTILKSPKYKKYRKMAMQRKFRLCKNCDATKNYMVKKFEFKR